MNYYNPYFYNAPSIAASSSPGLFRGLLGGARGVNWSSLLSNAQKMIGIVNQSIPVIKQVSPTLKNAKTMFKVMNEFKKVEPSLNNENRTSNVNTTPTTSNHENIVVETENLQSSQNDNGPRFFI